MPETKFSAYEVQALRAALSMLVIRDRTGELGIMHGADRFVSSQSAFTKPERLVLDSAAKKLGLDGLRLCKS